MQASLSLALSEKAVHAPGFGNSAVVERDSEKIANDKIWIHYDGIEDGITNELVAAGVHKDRIVLAFHPPQVREHTGYALA